MAVTAEQLWAAIKRVESAGNYQAHSKTSTASGVGQWVDGTWNHYGGYAHAYLAPPEVQEARGLHDVMDKLHAYGGDARKAAMSWFLPSAVTNPAIASVVPKGNGISPNQYADKVLAALGQPVGNAIQRGIKKMGQQAAGVMAAQSGNEADGTLAGQLANVMVGLSMGRDVMTAEF